MKPGLLLHILFIEESGPCQSINEFFKYFLEFTRPELQVRGGGYIFFLMTANQFEFPRV